MEVIESRQMLKSPYSMPQTTCAPIIDFTNIIVARLHLPRKTDSFTYVILPLHCL